MNFTESNCLLIKLSRRVLGSWRPNGLMNLGNLSRKERFEVTVSADSSEFGDNV
jgi:hypothetical protein